MCCGWVSAVGRRDKWRSGQWNRGSTAWSWVRIPLRPNWGYIAKTYDRNEVIFCFSRAILAQNFLQFFSAAVFFFTPPKPNPAPTPLLSPSGGLACRYQRKTSRRRPDQIPQTKKSRTRRRCISPKQKVDKALTSLRTRSTQIDVNLTSAATSVPCDAKTHDGRLSHASGLRG